MYCIGQKVCSDISLQCYRETQMNFLANPRHKHIWDNADHFHKYIVQGKWKSLSCVWLFATPWTIVCQAPLLMGIFQAKLLEWIAMPSSRGSSQARDWTQVSHIAVDSLPFEPPGIPWILEWVAYPFSMESSWPRNQTGVSCITSEFFISWATREAFSYILFAMGILEYDGFYNFNCFREQYQRRGKTFFCLALLFNESGSPALQVDSLPTELEGSPLSMNSQIENREMVKILV